MIPPLIIPFSINIKLVLNQRIPSIIQNVIEVRPPKLQSFKEKAKKGTQIRRQAPFFRAVPFGPRIKKE
jgi:hypothetical protein